MPYVTGIESVIRKLKTLRIQAEEVSKAVVVVGYTQRYAIYVHEDLAARHAEGKTAKYLEQPARRLAKTLAELIRPVYLRTGSMISALLVVGLRLQRESQLIVPVDTSALRASAFTAKEDEVEEVATAAFARSEAIRLAALGTRKAGR